MNEHTAASSLISSPHPHNEDFSSLATTPLPSNHVGDISAISIKDLNKVYLEYKTMKTRTSATIE